MITPLFFLAALAALPRTPLAHARTEFHFTVDLDYAQAAPLFGAWEEQKWAPAFKPEFVYPLPPSDQEGAIFRVQKGEYCSLWVNTLFDLPDGRVQYVYVLADRLVTRIDIRLAKNNDKTDVAVVYERTALIAAANNQVEALARDDAHSGDEWRDAINAYAARMKAAR